MSSIDAQALPSAGLLREQFERRRPFRHFVVDDFFAPAFCSDLLAQFPPFERGNARNEDGELGGKSTFERVRELGAAYVALDELVSSEQFLAWLSASTGIPDLLYDPSYLGGGTHDNRHGQDLDPHVDFNHHPENGWQRRLNLILYLNSEWDPNWGGMLELHTEPRSTKNAVTPISPLFNRCVVFETTEYSWHGFSRIELPAMMRDRSRRSIALYFYSRTRPEAEMRPFHQTIYVDRPLPAHLKAGHTLTDNDMQELKSLLARRDTHTERLYNELKKVGASLDGKPRGHVSRLTAGLYQLFSQRWVESKPLDRAQVKAAMLPFVAHLPAALREPLRRQWRKRGRATTDGSVEQVEISSGVSPAIPAQADTEESAYLARIAKETEIFASQANVHDLPNIFHYWSNRFLLPMMQAFGANNPDEFFVTYLLESARRSGNARPRFVSLGSGNCDAEVRVAQGLRERGLDDFVLECVDINPTMLQRGRELAAAAGLCNHVIPVQGDFNRWKPQGLFDGVMANQSLHHVLALEVLLDATLQSMAPKALFVVSDMIGRNGHQRWPEAMSIVREYWLELPESYRYNLQLRRQEDQFQDWDCSHEGFEGVRAQDILPLLLERFGFEVFIGFGSLIDPFIDRSFGHHFDPDNGWDRDFVDRVHARDEAELQAGNITPVHMVAVLAKDRAVQCRYRLNLSPTFCVRPPDQ